ncbi:MAG TPA: hypothetical protein VJ085_08810 [Candidatus Acidoferrales bacterium]|nr:hypothetical protein [Candidatus Acidoferrales bacterium]
MRIVITLLLALAAVLAAPTPAHAYVDPGAGSMLLQLLLGGVAGLFVFFRLFREKILKLFGFGKDDDSQ